MVGMAKRLRFDRDAEGAFRDHRMERFAQTIASGISRMQACEAAGISYETGDRWAQNPEMVDRIDTLRHATSFRMPISRGQIARKVQEIMEANCPPEGGVEDGKRRNPDVALKAARMLLEMIETEEKRMKDLPRAAILPETMSIADRRKVLMAKLAPEVAARVFDSEG